MSAATADATGAPKKGLGKKKLIILLAIVALLLVVAGGVVVYLKKKAAAQAEEEAEGDTPAQVESHGGAAKHDPKHPPTFVPLDMFTVNLADKEAERYAQIGVTLELDDAKVGDEIKVYMPAIRSGILMLLAHKTSQELLAREGKERLAFEIKREASRALGIEIEDEAARPKEGEAAKGAASEGEKPKKKKKPSVPSPVRQVHFSNFIIQ